MKYIVALSARGSIYHNEYSCDEVSPTYLARAASIEECRRRVRNYIEDYGLGSSQWSGGQVYKSNGEYVGRVSYNGRYWHKDTEYGKE